MGPKARKSRKLPLQLSLVCALAAAFPAGQPVAETCISPYVKALKQPEKAMYLWALPATPGQGEDFLAVIDVSLPSPTYGKVIKKIPVGSTGNEAHHIGYTDDRTKIWAASPRPSAASTTPRAILYS
jgi:selenium-binding protein 1